MARENPTWGYRRVQGALKNLGHRVARSTISKILQAHGIGPVPERPLSWRTFLAAHWGAIAAADFFTTEVWTVRGLVTYYSVFVIELASRRVQLLGSTPAPDDAFVRQVARTLTDADDGLLVGHRILICDRDTKWSEPFRQMLADSGIRVVQTPYRAPNCNAHAERFVRSIKEECLNRLVLVGEAHLRRTLTAFAAHYNEMIHNARLIPLDGRPRGALRQWIGDSRGHWEGDTLIVDTINFTDKGTGTLGLSPTIDENAHLTERFRRPGPSTLVYEFTVEDPTVWTRPWAARVEMVKSNEGIYEYARHEGNYGLANILRGARAAEDAGEHAKQQ